MQSITNLKDFLAHIGSDSPYQAGRSLYKYTDCGPWITYLIEKTPKRSVTLQVSVRIKNKKLHASVEESFFDYENAQAPEALSLLGFHADGSPRRSDKIGRTLDAYRRTIENFLKKDRLNGVSNTIGDTSNPYTLTIHPQRLTEIGYGRAPKAVNLSLHRIEEPTYEEVYYESAQAKSTLDKCAGIKMGSIVEGSEAYVDRDPMMFPFSAEEFDDYVKGINDEACFYWERDNLDHYTVEDGKEEYYITSGWGGELKLPNEIKDIVSEFIQANEIEDDKPITIPNTKVVLTKLSTDGWGY